MSGPGNIAQWSPKPSHKVRLADIPGQAIAISPSGSEPIEGGVVDADGSLMVVERVFGSAEQGDGGHYVLLRRPANWVFDSVETTASIQGWEHELKANVPILRVLDGEWTVRAVKNAVGMLVGQVILAEEPKVRALSAVVDSVLKCDTTPRAGEWLIQVALNRIGGTIGF